MFKFKVNDYVSFKWGTEMTGKIVKIQGNNVSVVCKDSRTGDESYYNITKNECFSVWGDDDE